MLVNRWDTYELLSNIFASDDYTKMQYKVFLTFLAAKYYIKLTQSVKINRAANKPNLVI